MMRIVSSVTESSAEKQSADFSGCHLLALFTDSRNAENVSS
jgi:hypothetical protein